MLLVSNFILLLQKNSWETGCFPFLCSPFKGTSQEGMKNSWVVWFVSIPGVNRGAGWTLATAIKAKKKLWQSHQYCLHLWPFSVLTSDSGGMSLKCEKFVDLNTFGKPWKFSYCSHDLSVGLITQNCRGDFKWTRKCQKSARDTADCLQMLSTSLLLVNSFLHDPLTYSLLFLTWAILCLST